VRTSTEVRGFTLAKLAFPFALGACDALSGDIAIFKDTGPLEPHVLAHEFSHRKGYWKELHAQALAYLALVTSGEPVLQQAARLERYFNALVAQGIGIWLGSQALINMGVNMGLLPTKGLTLPLMSFGGSSLLANCVALAILLRIDWENRQLARGLHA